MTLTIDRAGLERLLAERAGAGRRIIAAIAGAPGSGKSSLADALAQALNAVRPGLACVMPMDGFHFDDLHLVPAGLRPRKGAPETFDVGGLIHTLKRLAARDEDFVAVPVFDRSIEIARAGARLIPASIPIILAEGNYLLMDREPWAAARSLFEVTVLIEVPEEELRRRLRIRWEGYGLSLDEIDRKLEDNDLPNGRLVAAHSTGANYRLSPLTLP